MMNDVHLTKTKHTPEVNCSAASGTIAITGSSYPENTFEFYNPILQWMNQFMLESAGKITLNLNLDYMNSSSIKFISDMITKLNTYFKSGGLVELNWTYAEDDDDIREMGEELKEDSIFPFILKER